MPTQIANNYPPALALVGPTASGKSQAAWELAQHFPIEIVSVDSAQVYKHMDIGSAKPECGVQKLIPHHLLDLITPEENFSAARFCTDALAAMAAITLRGNIPLLVGGTMLYFKALLEGLAQLPPANIAIRNSLLHRAKEEGWPALHAELVQKDAQSAAQISLNDSQRIVRALEILQTSGISQSTWLARHHAGKVNRAAPLPYRLQMFALVPENRAALHGRIQRRFETMLSTGLVSEVEGLRAQYRLHRDLPAMRCVGYRQVWEMLEGQIPPHALLERGVIATRQLAKRQLTWLNGWFSRRPELKSFSAFSPATHSILLQTAAEHLVLNGHNKEGL